MFSNSLDSRKVRKPKIEKLRRARINSSLETLKDILLQNTISIPQGSRPTKLEKADILEMTVRYVEMLHEKLSMANRKVSKNLKENAEKNQWSSKTAFSEIANLMSQRNQPQWKTEGKSLNERNLSNNFDKENFKLPNVKQENHSTFDEEHWRPW